jgi:nucleoside-diphosphate-sugar epimerase
MDNVLEKDLKFILSKSFNSIDLLSGKSIFITGGTGFIGKWLLESLIYANKQGANIHVGVLSRNPSSFVKCFPHLQEGVQFYKGDIETFKFPEEKYDFVIHAATQASSKLNIDEPWYVLNNIINGTNRLLEYVEKCGARRILHTSSGAVYGVQPTSIDHVSEDYTGAPNIANMASAYGEGKRVSELLGVLFSKRTGVEFINARCFSFVGPYLPLDSNFAIGDFLLNGLKTEDISIKGDGTVLRSYMYAADLIIWLLRLLTHGENGKAYNVGSNTAYSIKDVAYLVQESFPRSKVVVFKQANINKKPERYLPSIKKAQNDLGLEVNFSLKEALDRTIIFLKKNSNDYEL